MLASMFLNALAFNFIFRAFRMSAVAAAAAAASMSSSALALPSCFGSPASPSASLLLLSPSTADADALNNDASMLIRTARVRLFSSTLRFLFFIGPSPRILPPKKFRSYRAKADRLALVRMVQRGSDAVPAPQRELALDGSRGTQTRWTPLISHLVGVFSNDPHGMVMRSFRAEQDRHTKPDRPTAPRT